MDRDLTLKKGSVKIKSTTNVNNFLYACSLGRLWLVKHFHEQGLIEQTVIEQGLMLAVKSCRVSTVRYILENYNIDLKTLKLLHYPCQKGHVPIALLLLRNGADVHQNNDESLLESVSCGNTRCVKLLLQNDANVHVENDLPLITACQMKNVHMVKILLFFGADIDAKNGQPLIQSCQNNSTEIMQILLKNGADITICNDKPLEIACKEKNVNMLILLLKYGASFSSLTKLSLDEITMHVVREHVKTFRKDKLRQAIRDSFKKHDFKWQEICGDCKNKNIYLLKESARSFGLEHISNSKREICKILAEEYEKCLKEFNALQIQDTSTDLSGTLIKDLEPWKIMFIEDIPFNCFDLFKLVTLGFLHNPYTKKPLPVKIIQDRETFLRKVLLVPRFKNENLLQKVAEEPLLSETVLLNNRLFNEVWENLMYPPSMTIFTGANDQVLNDMLYKLQLLCIDQIRPFPSIYFLNTRLYPMLTLEYVTEIKNAAGFEKKKKFVDLLVKMATFPDQQQDVRLMMMTILFKHFADINGNNNVNGNGNFYESNTNDNDDYLTFMTRSEALADDDDDEFLINWTRNSSMFQMWTNAGNRRMITWNEGAIVDDDDDFYD